MPQPSDQQTENRRGDQSIDAIEDAAVAGNEVACVLEAGAALQGRFVEIADLGGDAEDDSLQAELERGAAGDGLRKEGTAKARRCDTADQTRPGLSR